MPNTPDIVSTGWIRVLPEPGVTALFGVWRIAHSETGPAIGDLDDLDATALGVDEFGGLDVPIDSASGNKNVDVDEQAMWDQRWADWQAAAAHRERPMATYRDVIEFMAELGLLERQVDGGVVRWSVAPQPPLIEDVMPLSAEDREQEAGLRWRSTFQSEANAITAWLVSQRSDDDLVLEVETSLSDLAAELDLDLDNTRHGLSCAITEASDMWATPNPETALLTAPIRITVDWQRFDAERIAVQLNLPDDD